MRTAVKQGVSNCSYGFLPKTGEGSGKPAIVLEKPNKIKRFLRIRAVGMRAWQATVGTK